MKSSAKKVELASVDDLFSTEESRADAQREKVVEIPLSELHPFKGHRRSQGDAGEHRKGRSQENSR